MKYFSLTNKKSFFCLAIIILVIGIIIGTLIDKNYKKLNFFQQRSEIDLLTPYQGYGACHPKVVYIPDGLSGYKYWMAYTPYPKHNARYENPCIAVSNDLIHWKAHPKSKNVILDDNSYEKDPKKYNSDTHLIYNQDTKKLECWWRYVDASKDRITIFRRVSEDGIHWEKKEAVYTTSGKDKIDWVSPAIVYENGTYTIWFVNKKTIWYTKTSDLKTYTKPVEISIEYGEDLYPWHIDVEKTTNGYELTYVAYKKGAKDHFHMSLYHSISLDGIHFSQANKILSERKGKYWDNAGLYRSCLLYVKGTYYIIYTGWDNHDNVNLGYISGKDINHL